MHLSGGALFGTHTWKTLKTLRRVVPATFQCDSHTFSLMSKSPFLSSTISSVYLPTSVPVSFSVSFTVHLPRVINFFTLRLCQDIAHYTHTHTFMSVSPLIPGFSLSTYITGHFQIKGFGNLSTLIDELKNEFAIRLLGFLRNPFKYRPKLYWDAKYDAFTSFVRALICVECCAHTKLGQSRCRRFRPVHTTSEFGNYY